MSWGFFFSPGKERFYEKVFYPGMAGNLAFSLQSIQRGNHSGAIYAGIN
jgi:hypothetical protein